MSGQMAGNKPSQPAPEGQSKERMDVVLAYADGKTYEIPTKVAEQYQSSDDHDRQSGEEDEATGRHQVFSPARNRFEYHTNWMYGPYVWCVDGRTYRGPHWHPNPNSPYPACDMDDY